MTNYQILITTDTASLISAGKMKSDCGDIAFTDNDAVTDISYWLESGCNSASTKLWVKVPSIPSSSSTIYMYYGNPSATSSSNIRTTFMLGDDFNDNSINTTLWSTAAWSGLSVQENNNILNISGTTTGAWAGADLISKQTFNVPIIFEYKEYLNGTGGTTSTRRFVRSNIYANDSYRYEIDNSPDSSPYGVIYVEKVIADSWSLVGVIDSTKITGSWVSKKNSCKQFSYTGLEE